MKKSVFLLLLCVLLISAVSACAFFDGYGSKAYCIVDFDGCYVHDEDGNAIYIMFWSEASRGKIMGDLTAPGTDVVVAPSAEAAPGGHLPLMLKIKPTSSYHCLPKNKMLKECTELNKYKLGVGNCDPVCSDYQEGTSDGSGGYKIVYDCEEYYSEIRVTPECRAGICMNSDFPVIKCQDVSNLCPCEDYYQIVNGQKISCEKRGYADNCLLENASEDCPAKDSYVDDCEMIKTTKGCNCASYIQETNIKNIKIHYQCMEPGPEKNLDHCLRGCPIATEPVRCGFVYKTCDCGNYYYDSSNPDKRCQYPTGTIRDTCTE